MKELAYILATDVRAIDIAIEALRHVIPENNRCVPKQDYQAVMRHLYDWNAAIHARLERGDAT